MWQFRNGQIDRGGRSSGRRFAARGATTVFALMALLLIFVQVALAANPAPLQVYYIPVDEDDALASMQAINNSSSYKAVDPVTTYVSIAIGATGTLVYFDQWENGYDTDIANPANLYSSSNLGGTQIWGNGLCADGVAPSKTGVVPACTTANQATVDALSAGQVILLRNDVVSTTRQAVIDFDGGDKIGATEQIAVTRVFWADNSDTLLAAAIELYPTNEWGTLYVAPVGTNDTQYGSGSDLMFEYTSFAVQAATNGTQVAVDADGPGAGAATTFTLNQGESRIVSGILRGGTVTATNGSVQAHLLTGDVYNTAASYGYSGYTLFPRSKWGSSYWSPASTQADPAPTQITAYNPADQGSAIFVRCEFRTGLSISSSTQSIPAGESRAWEVPYTSGAHCFAVTSATNNTPVAKPFFAISTTDSAEFGSQYGGRGWDWGITLVPDESLSPLALVGLGLGQDPNQTITENGSPIWVTPVCASTYLYVDFDGNGVADKVDVNGDGDVLDTNVDGINETTSNNGMLLTTLQSVRVYNPGATSNQTGAQLRTKTAANQAWGAGTLGCDIVVAWGEDPTRASLQVPGFDVGTTVPPLSGFTVNKTAAMATDADGDGVITPGDTITYTIDIKNTGLAPILSAYVTDTVPSNTTYVASSTQTNKTGAWTLLADVGGTTPLAQAGGYPFVWSTSTTPTALNPGESFSIRFRVVVKDTTSCSESVVNNVIVRTGNKTKTANATTSLDCPAKLTIVKQANGPSATFAFTTTAVPDVPALAAGMASFNLVPAANSSASKVFDKILARTYTVRESTLPTGWSFDDVACVNNGSAPVSTYTKTGGTRQVNVALVEDGDVTCTFVNIGPPTIVIKKVTVPAGSTQQFNFTTTNLPGGNFSLTGAAGGDTKSVQVLPGTAYNVAESVPTGWVQTSATCDNGNAPSSITANAGQTVTCTFVNTLKGTLVVEKLTVPAGDATSFGFTSDVAGNTSFNLTGVPSVANTKAISVTPGAYNVTETGATNWTLTGLTCSDANSVANLGLGKATYNIEAGERVKCTFTNTRDTGQLEVRKVVVSPVNPDPGLFNLQIDGVTAGTGANAGHNGTTGKITKNTGSFTVGETAGTGTSLADYTQTSIVCKDGGGTGTTVASNTLSATLANVPVAKNSDVVCVITNTRKTGSLEVTKIVNWNGVTPEADTFEICILGPSYPTTANCKSITTAQVTNGDKLTWANLLPGVYSVAETGQPEWNTSVTGALASVPANGGTATASITNTRKIGSIVIRKIGKGGNDTFTYAVTGAAPVVPFSLITTGYIQSVSDSTNSRQFNSVPTGQYVFTESALPVGWDFTSVACTGDDNTTVDQVNRTATVNIDGGETVVCTYTNTKRGSLTVTKHVDWNGVDPDPAQKYSICISGPSYPLLPEPSQELCRDFNAGETFTFSDLLPGAYAVREQSPTKGQGWVINITPGNPIVTAGEDTAVVVSNTRQQGTLLVSKTVNATYTRAFDWKIAKSVTPATTNIFDGDSGVLTWRIDWTRTQLPDADHRIAGTINVLNNGVSPAVIVKPVDKLADGTEIPLTCTGVTFPKSIAPAASVTCTYDYATGGVINTTNFVTVTTTSLPPYVYTGNAPVGFGEPTKIVDASVTVSDTNGKSAVVGSTGFFTYTENVRCDALTDASYTNGKASFNRPNTVEIEETGARANATADINCYRLAVSKDAAPSLTRTWTWDIKKDVNTSIVHLFEDGTATLEYTVTVSNLGSEDSNRAATGSIVVRNPAPIAATLTTLADALPGATVGALTGAGCTEAPFTVPANSTLTCGYTATGFATTGVYTNTATAIAYGTSYTGTARIDFAAAQVTEVHPSIGVTDTNVVEPLGTGVTTSKKFTYTLPATCEGVEYVNGVGTKTLPNTAQIVETKQNSSQNVTVDCTQYGKLKVQKLVDWNGATPVPSQAFPIEVTGPDGFAQSFTLTDTQVITLTNLKPGSYTVTEGVMPAGYEQVSIVTSPVDVTPGATAAVVVNNRKLLGTVTVSKTAVPSFTREYQWTLDKSVTPSTLNLFEGEAALNANYTVSATVALTIDTGFRLKGAVTIANNGTNPALITSISDALSDSTAVALVCTLDGNALPLPLTSTLELGAGKSILCTYEHSFGDTKPAVTSNTASVQLTTGAPITGAAEFDFNTPTQKINESIDVKDMLEERATDKTWSYTTTQSGEQQKYSEPFNCAVEGLVYDANGKASYTRTNTVSSTTQGVTSTDQETVTVNCYRLVVTKTANTSYDNLYTWEISKTVDPTEVNMLQGQTQPLSYTVQVTRTGPFAQNFAVAGEITVVNPNPASAATGVVVTDKLVSGETPAPVCSSYDVPANGGSITCTYSTALSVGANTVNTATVAFLGKSYQGGAVVDFSKAAVTDINPSINVTDTNQAAPLGTEISESESFTYTLVATCDDAVYNEQTQRWEKVLPNTARIQQTGQTADANVQINCLKDGKIIIEKLTIPAGETQLFDFTTNFSPAFRLADGMTKSVPVMAGTYAITESLPITGWNLTDVRCVLVGTDTDPIPPAPSSVAAAPNPKSVTVGGGETWKCTFTNTKWGKLVVQKIAPDDTAKLFSFAGGVAGAIPHLGTLSADLQPGYYNVTEAVPAGWTLRGISPNCTQINDASVEGNGVNPTATAYVQPGLTTTCVFTNSLPSIAVIKTATPEKVPNPGADVVFNVSVKNTGKLDPVSITDLTDSIYGDITKVQGKVKATTCALGTTLQPGGVYACNFTAYVTTPSPTGQEYSETDVVTATGHTDFETQVSAHDDATVVVLAATAQLGDRVWLDRNPNGQSTPEKLAGDGLQNDPTEPGVGAVNVQLWGVGANGIAENGGGDDVLANAMATDAQGKYKFLTVTPGKYYLVFIKTPGPRAWSTLLNVGTDRTIDSDVKVDPADSNRAVTGVITVVPGTNDPTWDAAIVDTSGALSSDLGDLVWNDENKNGIQDAGEAGIPNIKVELFQVAQPTAAQAEAATAFATTTTSAAGVYNFRALDPGTYYVKVTVPADFTISPKNAGGDSTRDSDIDLTGRTANIVLPANTEDLTWDAGIFATPTVDEPSTEPQQPTATSVFLPTVLR